MKIYTKTGDSGKTSLVGGSRVPKYDIRIDACGTVDELISWIGLLRDQDIDGGVRDSLLEIQDRLMICASILASDCDNPNMLLPVITGNDIKKIENLIDEMEEELEPLKNFILPGGHTYVSWCHIARNVCRRAERNSLKLSVDFSVDVQVVKYLNRLSDYLFVLSRKLGRDLGVKEIPWKPGL